MQTQDASADLLFKIWPWLEANKNRLIAVGIGIVVVGGVIFYITSQREQNEVDAGQAMTTLMVDSAANNLTGTQLAANYAQLAEKYSGTMAGSRAQLEAGWVLFGNGTYPEAEAKFQKLYDASQNGPLAATALLGMAVCEESQNKPDLAAGNYQRIVSLFHDSPCVPAAEYALGRMAMAQNKLTEALGHFKNAASSPLAGSIGQEAMIRGAEINAKLAATQAKPAATITPATTMKPQPAAVQPAAK